MFFDNSVEAGVFFYKIVKMNDREGCCAEHGAEANPDVLQGVPKNVVGGPLTGAPAPSYLSQRRP